MRPDSTLSGGGFQKLRIRESFISGFVTSSQAGMQRLYAWSHKPNSREIPCSMEFHDKWQHTDCPVMKWYTIQRQHITKFTTIQHWRSLNAPFFHEYLIIPFPDGSLYRIERVGDGARIDAIRWAGCAAHDIIQWFSAETYNTSPLAVQPCELILEANFSGEFDILDILSICFAIQKHHQTAAYTLQRFNCYFLCTTVLVILTRRLALWESSVSGDWTNIVEQAFPSLSNTSHWSPYDQLVLLGAQNTLGKRSQDYSSLIHQILKGHLETPNASSDMCASIGSILWHHDIYRAMHTSLRQSIAAATSTIRNYSNKDSAYSTKNPRVADAGLMLKAQSDAPFTHVHITKMFSKGWYDILLSMYRSQQNHHRMIWARRNYCMATLLTASALGPIYGYFKMWPKLYKSNFIRDISSDRFTKIKLTARLARIGAKEGKYMLFTQNDSKSEPAHKAQILDLDVLAMRHFVSCLHQVVQHPDFETEELLQSKYFSNKVWEFCLLSYASNRIGSALLNRLSTLNAPIMVASPGEERTPLSVAEFQHRLRDGIRVRAERVGGAGLAFARFVQGDVEHAMSSVWLSLALPSGFGGDRSSHPGSEPCLPVLLQDWVEQFNFQ